jgi:hypothetical protein
VRLKVLASLAKAADVMGAAFLQSTVLPALVALGNDTVWRVREKVIEQVPLLAGQLVRERAARARRGAARASRCGPPAPPSRPAPSPPPSPGPGRL